MLLLDACPPPTAAAAAVADLSLLGILTQQHHDSAKRTQLKLTAVWMVMP